MQVRTAHRDKRWLQNQEQHPARKQKPMQVVQGSERGSAERGLQVIRRCKADKNRDRHRDWEHCVKHPVAAPARRPRGWQRDADTADSRVLGAAVYYTAGVVSVDPFFAKIIASSRAGCV